MACAPLLSLGARGARSGGKGGSYVQNMDSVLAAAAAAAAPLDCAAIKCGSGGSRQSGDHADSPAVPATDCHKAW